MYVRMVIGELHAPHMFREFQEIVLGEFALFKHDVWPGFESAYLLEEEVTGTMTVMIFTFETAEDGKFYYASLAYRNLVKQTRHLLIGDFVVRTFLAKGEA